MPPHPGSPPRGPKKNIRSRSTRHIEGFRAIWEALRDPSFSQGKLLLSTDSSRASLLKKLAQQRGLAVSMVSKTFLDHLAPGENHRGFLLEVLEKSRPTCSPTSLSAFIKSVSDKSSLVLVLDEITDPHNYGAILRSADLFGVDLVIKRKRRAAPTENTAVDRTSSGANRFVPALAVPNLPNALKSLKEGGFWIYGTDREGEPLRQESFPSKIALVFGSEASGMGSLIRKSCDKILSIPLKGHIDSLNVSVAAGICLYEISQHTTSPV